MTKREMLYAIALFSVLCFFIVLGACTQQKVELEEMRYVVKQGDTLYGIAREYCPNEFNSAEYIALVQKVNGIGADLYVGQDLIIFKLAD